jgi:glycosyltransferase involved in cell wall biosynthesis
MNPLVTVAIVTWNSRRHIERCIEAVCSQDYWPWEVIIVDNS